MIHLSDLTRALHEGLGETGPLSYVQRKHISTYRNAYSNRRNSHNNHFKDSNHVQFPLQPGAYPEIWITAGAYLDGAKPARTPSPTKLSKGLVCHTEITDNGMKVKNTVDSRENH